MTGSIGAIHANRLSTSLHSNLNAPTPTGSVSSSQSHIQMALSAFQGMLTLFILAFPLQACFLAFVHWAGWIDLSLGLAGWVAYGLTVSRASIQIPNSHSIVSLGPWWNQTRLTNPVDRLVPPHGARADTLLLVKRPRSRFLHFANTFCPGRLARVHLVDGGVRGLHMARNRRRLEIRLSHDHGSECASLLNPTNVSQSRQACNRDPIICIMIPECCTVHADADAVVRVVIMTFPSPLAPSSPGPTSKGQ